jgi:hypothetical protein
MPSSGCEARTRAGDSCRATPLTGRPYCFTHDPEAAEVRRAARRRGGERSRRRPVELVELRTPEDVRAVLERLLAETLALRNSTPRNRCAGYLLSLLLKAVEVGELEERIAELEAREARPGALEVMG